MVRTRVVAAVATVVLVTGGTVAMAQEGDATLLAAAEDAADEAAERTRELAQEAAEAAEQGQAADDAEDDDARDDTADGVARGFGSAAFRERHAMLAEEFAARDHPVFDTHPAARVHAALADGDNPSGVGRAQAEAAHRMAQARRDLTDGAQGQGRGPEGAGPPGQAGRDDP